MSLYSIGKNEVKCLIEQEAKMKKELETINNQNKGNIYNFQSIHLQNEIRKVHNKLQILVSGQNSSDDGDIA